jgi:glycosyltransferase involved in cell wall biosynthesis
LLPGCEPVPAGGRKIAVVDLLFGWPPHGGAPRDLYEVFRQAAKSHHVRFILPALHDVITRGRLDVLLPYEAQLIRCVPEDYRDSVIGEKLKAAVDEFEPEAVFVGDGWAMKPVVARALAPYRPVVRFYAYEVACFRGAGELFRDGKPCPDSWLKTLSKQDHRRCMECCLEYFVKDNPRESFFRKELIQSGAFEAGYPDFVAETLAGAGALVCYNRTMAGILGRHNPNTHVVTSGVDLEAFVPVAPEEVAPGQILFAGRVYDAKKGFSWAIEACDLLWSRGARFRLFTTGVGRPVEREYLDNVGWIADDARLAGLMARSAVCLVPSLWPEALGMTALEAMASGRPLVASRTGGLGELFTDGRQGYYVEPGDVAGLADVLGQLLDNPERGHALGRAGRELAEASYGWPGIVRDRIMPLLFP